MRCLLESVASVCSIGGLTRKKPPDSSEAP